MINKTVLVGRLTKDVELRFTPNGKANAKVTVACQREFKNSQGERDSDFIQVECWGKTAELLGNHFKKGDVVGFEGPIRTGSYEGQDGKRVYTTHVHADSIKFIQGNNRNNDSGQANGAPSYGGQTTYSAQPAYPPQGAATQPPQQYTEQQVQEYLNQQQQKQQQTNYQRVDEDPFANSKGPIEVSSDELPF